MRLFLWVSALNVPAMVLSDLLNGIPFGSGARLVRHPLILLALIQIEVALFAASYLSAAGLVTNWLISVVFDVRASSKVVLLAGCVASLTSAAAAACASLLFNARGCDVRLEQVGAGQSLRIRSFVHVSDIAFHSIHAPAFSGRAVFFFYPAEEDFRIIVEQLTEDDVTFALVTAVPGTPTDARCEDRWARWSWRSGTKAPRVTQVLPRLPYPALPDIPYHGGLQMEGRNAYLVTAAQQH